MIKIRKELFWYVSSFVITLFFTFFLLLHKPIDQDVAFYLYSVDMLVDGAELYTDIYDHNPPVNFFLTFIPVLFARWINISFEFAHNATFSALSAAIIFLTIYLVRNIIQFSVLAKIFLFNVFAIIVFILPITDFGTRDNLVFLLLLPYIALSFKRLDSPRELNILCILVGVFAGVGLLVKPFYISVPIVIIIFRYFTEKRPSVRELEHIALLATGVIGLLLVIFYCPQYFETMPVNLAAQQSFNHSLIEMLSKRRNLYLLVAIGAVLFRFEDDQDKKRQFVLIVTIGFWLAYIIQQKAYPYQRYTYYAGILLCFGFFVASLISNRCYLKRNSNKIIALILLCLLMRVSNSIASTTVTYFVREVNNYYLQEQFFKKIFRQGRNGSKTITWMDSGFGMMFPLALEENVRMGTRYPSLFALPSQYKEELLKSSVTKFHKLDAMSKAERMVFDNYVKDFLERKPDVIIVNSNAAELPSFDFIAYFSQDEAFKKIIKNYTVIKQVASFTVLKKSDSNALD